MAWSRSGVMGQALLDQFDPSDLSLDLTAEDGKNAMWGSSVTPNFNTDTAYGSSPWNSGEANGAGYSAGGEVSTGTTVTISGNRFKYTYDNIQIDDSTIEAEGYVNWFPNKSNRIFGAVWFGEVLETQDGTFLVTHDPAGAFYEDL